MLVGKDYARLGSAGWLNWDLSANMVIKKKKKKKRKKEKKKKLSGFDHAVHSTFSVFL